MKINGYDIFPYAYLRYADLRNVDLRNIDLHNADLSEADLRDADLRKTDLSDADLQGADLRYADLRDADLSDADLQGADLRYADLQGANLCGVNIRATVGNMNEIKTILCDTWHISYTTNALAIGCQQYVIARWWEFSDDIISKMDPRALDWWRIWKPILRQIISASPATGNY